MNQTAEQILKVLDDCCDAYTFPMLDNGYVYLAATRLSLFRSQEHWALVNELFGFSPREGLPSLCVSTFSDALHARDLREHFVSDDAYRSYLETHPFEDLRFFHPVAPGPWQAPETEELVAEGATSVAVRGNVLTVPPRESYAEHDIQLADPVRVQTFELARYLAAIARPEVLASESERRVSVPPDMQHVLLLEAWHHPNVVALDRPGATETFQQLARVLVTGDSSLYRPSQEPNTHWKNWPDGGTL